MPIVNDAIDRGTQLNFEQRALAPSKYPVIKNDDGSVSTHRMAYGEADGKYFAYPTIVQGPSGKLVQLDQDQAWRYAMQTKQYREFADEKSAAEYAAGGYKRSWGAAE